MSEDAGSQSLHVSLDVSAVPGRPVGVGRFVLDLVRVLARRDGIELTLWSRRDDGSRWSDAGTRDVRALAPTTRPARLLWEQARLPRRVDGSGAAVHHGPHYTMPERAHLPCLVTIHDMTFFDHPEWHERTKVRVFTRAIRVASRKARAVLCDSERTAARLNEICRPAGRVFVVPLGVDLDRFRPSRAPGDEEILRSLGVQEPYVLFLGTLEPRKAVPELVRAFDLVAGGRPDLVLVLAGAPGWGAREVDLEVARARHAERIRRTGYVEDAAVPVLLRRSAVVAYPAREEGFGLPALEALACGAPLVTTAGTVMSDLAGEAAFSAAPGSVEEIAQAIEAALEGDGAERRRQAGLEIASAHSWEATADSHLAAYRWAAGTL
jgi:glycosyltransferase involved in cell wall biosynthesis